jgi:formyltetrahydrofolate-dependent phosphoribosylglycinamide formyltransferase
MLALAASCEHPEFPAEVAAVISPKSDTPAAEGAREKGLNVVIVDPHISPDYGADLISELSNAQIEWICLAGYLRLLPPEVLSKYEKRILNIHPALLPRFGGKGMYGMRVHEAVLASGETESGCSVHFVTENYDEGPIILQRKCPVEKGDTPETLALRVLKLEHQTYSEALRKVIEEAEK